MARYMDDGGVEEVQKKILKRKILLALCLGSMVTIQPAYAATGYTVSGDNVTVNTSEISKVEVADEDVSVIGVRNPGFSNFTLSYDPFAITAKAISKYGSAMGYGISDRGSTRITGDAVITSTAIGGDGSGAYLSGYAKASGIVAGISRTSIGRNAVITATATGGEGSAVAVSVSAEATGIDNSYYTSIGGNAAIAVTATGGSAVSSGLYANADAYGINTNASAANTSIIGDADITVIARGGSAALSDISYADARAYGLRSLGSTGISGGAEITVTAVGGSSATESASAEAYGILTTGTGSASISGDTIITVTATGGSATSYKSASAAAYGIYTYSGRVDLDKNTTITAKATVNSGNAASAYSLYAEDGTININQAAGNPYTVKLTGDVLAEGGTINLALNNSSSFLRGNVVTSGSGTINMTLSNNAVWQPVYDNRNGTITYATNQSLSGYSATENTVSALTLSGGIIDLTWDDNQRTSYRKLNVNTLNGNGGTLKLNTDMANSTGDTAAIGTLSSAATLKVAVTYDRSLSTITQPTTIYASGYTPVSAASGASNLTLAGVTTDSGAFSLTPTFNGTSLTSLAVGVGSNTKAAASSASSQANMLQTSVNHLRKRLGDLRDAPEAEDGIWARIYSGEVSNDKYTSIESAYKGTQIGYDKSHQVKDGRTYTGGAVSYTEADNSFSRGGGESKDCDLALYQTWIGNDGHYYDLIAKHGRLSSDYHVTDLSNNYSTADYHSQTSSLSAEYGYRGQLKDGWYLEPQVELTYGHINGVNYKTSSGLSVKQDGIDRLIGRLGLGLGKKLTTGANLYTSLSVLHEFNGEENVKADTLNYSQDMGGTWYEFILGASGKLSKHSTGYVNVEKLFGGDVSSDWQFNVGCRWSF
ncbi:MAG: prn 4 [Firmicutes bacterium]|nr:prn 4 [Bacillota bacterium]